MTSSSRNAAAGRQPLDAVLVERYGRHDGDTGSESEDVQQEVHETCARTARRLGLRDLGNLQKMKMKMKYPWCMAGTTYYHNKGRQNMLCVRHNMSLNWLENVRFVQKVGTNTDG